MAVFLSGTSENVDWLIWQIDEDVETLKSLLGNFPHQEFEKYRTEKRQKEFLTSRIALNKLFTKPVSVSYKTSGKPCIEHSNYHISISHSGAYVVVAKSPNPFGIDIEEISNKLDRVKHKFCSQDELNHLQSERHLNQLGLIWSAKESMYKAIGDYPFEFNQDLHTKIESLKPTGILPASTIINSQKVNFRVHYTEFANYIFTIAVMV